MMCVWHLQDDFGVDQEDVYEVVAAWNEHSEDVETYVALQEDTGLDAHGLKEAVRQWREQKADYAQYEALRKDTGMDAEGMRKVMSSPFSRGSWVLHCCCKTWLSQLHRAVRWLVQVDEKHVWGA